MGNDNTFGTRPAPPILNRRPNAHLSGRCGLRVPARKLSIRQDPVLASSGTKHLDQIVDNTDNFGFRRRGARAAKGGRL